MKFFYNFILTISEKLLFLFGNFFGNKVKKFKEGQKKVFEKLEECNFTRPVVWVHVSSLGEYEQALPLIEEIQQKNKYQILVTFFSPSGYEIIRKKNPSYCLSYLPLDIIKNVKRFLNLVNPSYVFFVKYDLWPNYLTEISKRNIPAYLISAVFTKNHPFLKPFNQWMKRSLKAFKYIFVQNENSKQILEKHNFKNAIITGDTRFDRVKKIAETHKNNFDFIRKFKQGKLLFIAGSTWEEDENLIIEYLKKHQDLKVIIAPHEISENHINSLKSKLPSTYILFSEINDSTDLKNYDILILNTIGILNKIYKYADWVYVGGGFGKSIHNIQEPAVYGKPVITGPKIQKFKEAIDLKKLGGITVVTDSNEFTREMDLLQSSSEIRELRNRIISSYIEKNLGATEKIMNKLDL